MQCGGSAVQRTKSPRPPVPSLQHCTAGPGRPAGQARCCDRVRRQSLRHPACSRGLPARDCVHTLQHVRRSVLCNVVCCCALWRRRRLPLPPACIGMPPGLKSGAFRFIADCADCADAPTAGRICAAECIGPAEPPSQSARAADGPSCGCTNTNTNTSMAGAGGRHRAHAHTHTTRTRTPRAKGESKCKSKNKRALPRCH